MSKTFIVNSNTYTFPENRDSPSWGEEVTAWASAVTDITANISGVDDKLLSSAIINNNTTADVAGLLFDPTLTRGAICEYSVYRVTTSPSAERVEVGQVIIAYLSSAGSYEIVQYKAGDSGLTLSITNLGQVRYTSDNMTGVHNGVIKFRARALPI